MASASGDADIHDNMEALAVALRAKDIDRLMTYYAPDVVVFDLRPPQRIQGVDAYRKNFEAWFASVDGPIGYEMHNLGVTTSGSVAFCDILSHVKSVRTTGEKADYWVRVTAGLRNMNGRWLITHEHISMPIDMQARQAVTDLQN